MCVYTTTSLLRIVLVSVMVYSHVRTRRDLYSLQQYVQAVWPFFCCISDAIASDSRGVLMVLDGSRQLHAAVFYISIYCITTIALTEYCECIFRNLMSALMVHELSLPPHPHFSVLMSIACISSLHPNISILSIHHLLQPYKWPYAICLRSALCDDPSPIFVTTLPHFISFPPSPSPTDPPTHPPHHTHQPQIKW